MNDSEQKYFVGICGGRDFGKSVELKNLIYALAQDDKTESCLVKLVKLSCEKQDYYDDLVEEDFVKNGYSKDAEKLKQFLEHTSTCEVDLKNPDYLKQFKDCIEQRFKNHERQYHELDFVARIIYNADVEKKEIVICTIGDKIKFIRDNISNELIQKSDLIVCSLRNYNKIKEAVVKDCVNNGLLCLKVKVSKSKKIKIKQMLNRGDYSFENEIEIDNSTSTEITLPVDELLKKFLAKLKEGFGTLIDWLKKNHKN